jgi:hypothetical protein
MSDDIKSQNPVLFINLSEQEQEVVAGGISPSSLLYDVLIKRTDITSIASNEYTISDGTRSFSSKSTTLYNLSEVTFGFNFSQLLQGFKGSSRVYAFQMLVGLLSAINP